MHEHLGQAAEEVVPESQKELGVPRGAAYSRQTFADSQPLQNLFRIPAAHY